MKEITEYERLEATGEIQRVRYPDVEVQLSEEDGNIYAIIGRTRRALRRAGVSDVEIERFSAEVQGSENYDVALMTVMEWVEVL